jgi:hypothetical protein
LKVSNKSLAKCRNLLNTTECSKNTPQKFLNPNFAKVLKDESQHFAFLNAEFIKNIFLQDHLKNLPISGCLLRTDMTNFSSNLCHKNCFSFIFLASKFENFSSYLQML